MCILFFSHSPNEGLCPSPWINVIHSFFLVKVTRLFLCFVFRLLLSIVRWSRITGRGLPCSFVFLVPVLWRTSETRLSPTLDKRQYYNFRLQYGGNITHQGGQKLIFSESHSQNGFVHSDKRVDESAIIGQSTVPLRSQQETRCGPGGRLNIGQITS